MAEGDNGAEFENDEARNTWLEGLPEPVRGWQEAATAKSPDSFWKSITDNRSAIANSLRIPTEDASPEQLEQFFGKVVERSNGRVVPVPRPDDGDEVQKAYRAAMGVPEAPDAYQFPDIKDLPANFLPEDRANAFREIAHKHGISSRQFTNAMGDILQFDLAAAQAGQAAQDARQDGLKEEWGDAYDQRYQRVTAFLERDGAPPDLIAAAAGKGLGPETAKYFYGLVERMGSESAELARQTGGATVDTPADIEARITDIISQDGRNGRPLGPYWDDSHPEHGKVLKRVIKMREMLSGPQDKVVDNPTIVSSVG